MPTFDIVRKSEVDRTFRTSRISNDYDIELKDIEERFTGDIELPDEWQIGLIVGNSGTGKTTIATEMFGDHMKNSHGGGFSSKSVIDDMPKVSFDEIIKMFYTVGFSSVPSWLKPYSVLSNGEKMRVELAYSLLSDDFVCFDEFTSVVDRNVAKTICQALSKNIKRSPNKKFVAVSCHRDIIEYLQPDWVFDTDEMRCFFQSAHAPKEGSKSGSVGAKNGRSLDAITI